jgi:LysR family transcriptional regulator, glycine cleavage system transcriptional activator
MNLPSLDSLICFEAAARLLNFREAAKVVCLTPAAVGQRIKQLEEQLGVMLFHRTSRSVQLTEEGLALLPVARNAIAAAEACIHAVRAKQGPPPQEVTIGTTHEIGLSWLTPSLAKMSEALPQVTVHLHFGAAPDVLSRVKSREIDAAVTSYRLTDPSYDAIDLVEERYVFVASKALLSETPLASEADTALHTLLDVRPSLPMLQHLADSPDLKAKLSFAQVRFLGSTEAVRRLALDGRGVAVLPSYLVEHDLLEGRLTILLPEVKLLASAFRIVFSKDDTRRGLYEALSKVLIAVPISAQ